MPGIPIGLEDWMNAPIDPSPDRAYTMSDEDSIAGTSAGARLSTLMRATQQYPQEDTFQNTYRKSISPGREFLADFFGGMSSKFLGNEFVPLRARMFKEYQEQQKNKLSQERLDQTLLIAKTADERARKLAEDRNRLTEQANDLRRLDILNKDALGQKRTDILERSNDIREKYVNGQIDKIQMELEMQPLREDLIKAQTKKAGVVTDSYNAARQVVESQGINPDDNMDSVLGLAKQIEEVKKAGKFPPQISPGAGMRDQNVQNIYGEPVTVTHDMRNGTFNAVNVATGQPDQVARAGQQQQKEYADMQDTSVFSRNLIEQIKRNPGALRGKAQIASELFPTAERLFNLRTPEERQIGNSIKQGLFQKIRSISGAAFTDSERAAHASINASPVDTPLNALTSLATATILQSAVQARRALNLSPDQLDFAPIIDAVRENIRELSKEGQLSSFTMPSDQQLIQFAARKKGRTAVFDNNGRFRELR